MHSSGAKEQAGAGWRGRLTRRRPARCPRARYPPRPVLPACRRRRPGRASRWCAGQPGSGSTRGRRARRARGRRLGLLGSRLRGNGLGLVAGSPEALLGTLLGESVARADLNPRGSGLAGGLNLGGLQFVCRFSQAPGGFEPADRPVGGVESAERSQDPLGRTLGGHAHSVFDTRYRSMIR